MKQNLLTKVLLLFALIVGSSSVAWAQTERSYTLTFKDSGNSSDGTSAYNKNNVSNVLSGGTDYVSSISALSKVYPARTGRGAKFGSSSDKGSITFTLSDDGKVKAKKVVIKGGAYIASGAAENASVKVNGGTAVAFDQSVTSYTEEEITYTFSSPTDIETLKLEQVTKSNGRFYVVSVTVYWDEDDDTKETATWSLEPTSAIVTEGESTTLQLTTNYDGTLNFTSNATTTATVSYNSQTKVITVNGVKAGSTSITVTGNETDTYKAINKTIDVTVNHAELANNVVDNMSGFGYTYFGLTPSGSNTYVQPNSNTTKTDGYGVTLTFKKADGGNDPRFDEKYVRFYSGNTLTVNAPVGSYITKVVFIEPTSNKQWEGSFSVGNIGEYDNTQKTWYATETGVTELVFTGTTGTVRFAGLGVYLMTSSVTVTPAKEYVSFCSLAPLDFSEVTGLTAYIVSAETDNSVTLSSVNKVPANTGLVLKKTGTETSYTVPVLTGDADTFTNRLEATGTNGATVEASSVYVLSDGKFKLFTGTSIAGGKAYLPKTEGAPSLDLDFGEGTTGIQNIERTVIDNQYYTLDGRRVAEPTKGLYIINGKKVVIK